MNNKFDITFVNNNIIGYFDNGKYKQYNKDEKLSLFDKIRKYATKSDILRRRFSLIIGIILVLSLVILTTLMITGIISLGKNQWFIYIFVFALFVLLWVVFYYLFGFIFYKKLQINIHFKGTGDFANNYAKSNYAKWINRYKDNLGKTNFILNDNKNTPISFGLSSPSLFKNLIFNGKISSNIPYFYMSYKSCHIIFMPSFVLIINKDKTDIIEISNFNYKKENNNYELYNKDTKIISFHTDYNFDINFFYFNFDY